MTHKESDGRQNDGTRPLPSTDTSYADENVNSLDLVEPENALPDIALADLPAVAQKAAASAGWSNLMPVQAKAIPYLLAGRDLMVQSRTGSGKTARSCFPCFIR